MAFRVREDQRRAPRPSMQKPALDPQVLAQELHVCQQMLGRVDAHVGCRIACVRSASPAAALVEQHDPIAGGVERSARAPFAARAGPTVDDEPRLALRIAARLPVEGVAVAHVEDAVVVRLGWRIRLRRQAFSAGIITSPTSRLGLPEVRVRTAASPVVTTTSARSGTTVTYWPP